MATASVWRLRVEAESFDWSTGEWSIDRVLVDGLKTEIEALEKYGRAVAQLVDKRPPSPRRYLRAFVERRPLYTDKWIKTQTIHHQMTDN
jgi:hypothetical protein